MRYWYVIGIVWAALAVLSPSPAGATSPLLAAKAGGEGGEKAKRFAIEEGLFKGAVEVSLWTILVFLILMSVLRKYAWAPIRDGLDKREQALAKDKYDAEQARREAALLREQLQAEMARANETIRQMVEKARQDAQQTAAEELARGKAELAAERQRLHREIRIAEDDALNNIWGQSVQLATLISSKAIRKQLGDGDHRAELDGALAEFKSAARSRLEDIESARA